MKYPEWLKPIVWRWAAVAGALLVAALALYAYRGLSERPFAADDYQWLLNVRDLSFGQVVRAAFDAGAQSHFYRPLVWLLFWVQSRAFGLDPRGYHAVSLALHLLDAALLGALAWRLGAGRWGALLAACAVALHPAPFEAVVWISAQSELLAAALLLAMLHLWRVPGRAAPLLATVALGLALLAKESAVIGLPLLMLLGRGERRTTNDERRTTNDERRTADYALATLITAVYAALQVAVERRNYLLQGGQYGLGAQLVLNPLRSLALLVAPLPGTEHADTAWLVPLGAAAALGLLALLARGPSGARRLALGLLLTLLPTAPFAAPPNSRYLYPPVLAAALLLAFGLGDRRPTTDDRRPTKTPLQRWSMVGSRWSMVARWSLVILLAWAATRELGAREARFAAGIGPGGSLGRTAASACAERAPRRVIVVEPPIAPQHVEGIIHLACGRDVRPLIVGRDGVAGALKRGSLVIGFVEGTATVEQKT